MSQQEELEKVMGETSEKPENKPDLDSWMSPEDWEEIQLDQIKLMLSDESKPDFDLDAAIGFDRSELAGEVSQLLEGEEIPEFATRRSRQVEHILRQNRPASQPARPRADRPIAPEFDDEEGPAQEPAEKSRKRSRGKKQEPVPPKPEPMSREAMPLREALDRVHADDEVKECLDARDQSIEEILAGIDLGPAEEKKSAAARRWEAEMPELTCPTPEKKAPATRKEKKEAARQEKLAREQAEAEEAQRQKARAEAEKAKKKADKLAKKAAKREARKNSLTGVITVIVLELAGIGGILGWWYQWMH